MFKYADTLIVPQHVSQRADSRGRPTDKVWSNQRRLQRIREAGRQGWHSQQIYAKKKGLGLLSWLYGLGGWMQGRIRSFFRNDLQGGQYDYSKYSVPQKAGDVVIAFAGARQAPGKGMDQKMRKKYGANNYVIFRPGDVKAAVQYANKLPQGSRVFVQGHSHGGAAAAWFAQKYGKPIERMITYDPVGNFGQPQQKPQNVKRWFNAVAGDYREQQKYSNPLLKIPAKIGSDWADVLVDYMGRWGNINGAENYYVPQAGHSDVQKMYKAMKKDIAEAISKGKISRSKYKV